MSRTGKRIRVGVVLAALALATFGLPAASATAATSHAARGGNGFVLTRVSLHTSYLHFLSLERPEPTAYLYRRGYHGSAPATPAACTEPDCPMSYHGGAVQGAPEVWVLFWGPNWSYSASDTNYLMSLFEGLGVQPQDDWSTTMEQYGVSAGYPTFTGHIDYMFDQDTSTPPYDTSAAQLAAEADAEYAKFSQATPAVNTQIFVVTQSGTCPDGFAGSGCGGAADYCAWHSDTSVYSVPFTNLPYIPDAGASCGEDSVNSGGTYDGFSIVGGHEFAETVTDPYPDSGWNDQNDQNDGGGEVGDKCAWTDLFDQTLSTGSFAMQPLWSNHADACVQETAVSAPSAPGGAHATAANAQATVSFNAPASDGNATIQGYTVTARDQTNASRGGQTASGTSSPITVTGLTNGDSYTFTVQARNANGAGAASAPSNAVTPSGPQVGAPTSLAGHFVFADLSAASSPTVPDSFTWKAGTCKPGATYTLSASENGGPKTQVAQTTALSANANLVPWALYSFSVACGGAASQTTLRVDGYQQTSAAFSAGWKQTSFAGAWGGTAAYSTTKNAAASFTCICEAIAWVTDEDTTHGSARVYVDGVARATVSTHSSAKNDRFVVFKYGWTSVGRHTIKIVNLATPQSPRVTIDGFLTRRPD